MIEKEEHKRIVQSYKNIIDQKELEIDELKKQNKDLKKKLKEEKNYQRCSMRVHECPNMILSLLKKQKLFIVKHVKKIQQLSQ